MQAKFLLLVPVLISIAGCSEKIEAQENAPAPGAVRMPSEREEEAAGASEEQETDLKLHSPVGLD